MQLLLTLITYPLRQLVCIAYECRRQRRLRSTSRILLIRDGASFGLVLRVGIIGIFSLLSLGSDQFSTLVDELLLILMAGCQPSTCSMAQQMRIGFWVCIFTLLGLDVSNESLF